MSKPRGTALWVAALLGLAPAASAGAVGADNLTSSFPLPGTSALRTLDPAKTAPVAGGRVVTTSESDTNGDGTVDQRSIFTTNFDSKGRVVRSAEEYDTGADGTVEA